MAEPRRYPPPWTAERTPAGYKVMDANQQTICWIYARESEQEARQAKVHTFKEARVLAVNIAKLPQLLGAIGADRRE